MFLSEEILLVAQLLASFHHLC